MHNVHFGCCVCLLLARTRSSFDSINFYASIICKQIEMAEWYASARWRAKRNATVAVVVITTAMKKNAEEKNERLPKKELFIKRTHVQCAQFFELIFRLDLYERCMCEIIFPAERVCMCTMFMRTIKYHHTCPKVCQIFRAIFTKPKAMAKVAYIYLKMLFMRVLLILSWIFVANSSTMAVAAVAVVAIVFADAVSYIFTPYFIFVHFSAHITHTQTETHLHLQSNAFPKCAQSITLQLRGRR